MGPPTDKLLLSPDGEPPLDSTNVVRASWCMIQVEKAGVTNEHMVLMLNALQVRERFAAVNVSDMHCRHP